MQPDDELQSEAYCSEGCELPARAPAMQVRPRTAGALDVARRSILMSDLPERIADQVLARAVPLRFRRGETIFLQNQRARSICIVLEGWVKLYRMTQSGGEAVIAVYAAGQSIGEAVAFQGHPYPVTGEAVTDCRVLQIDPGVFLDVVKAEPESLGAVLSAMSRHLHFLVAQIEALKARTGAQRVAGFLLELCEAEKGPATVVLPYDKNLIAGRLGMKPESLSRAFSRLRRDAGVRVAANVATIRDVEALQRFAIRDPALAWSRSG